MKSKFYLKNKNIINNRFKIGTTFYIRTNIIAFDKSDSLIFSLNNILAVLKDLTIL